MMVDIITDPLVLPDYPNVLAEPSPKRMAPARRPFVLIGLFLLCLAPRAWIATKCTSVCPDATLYIGIAKTIESGQWDSTAMPLSRIAYPTILAALHHVGFDWETGARCWGVLLASLAVLPLFGWVRRQFDDRVALAACFLYAVHPRLVEWSPSIIRDPTFWFLFLLSIYLLWRAIGEVRLFFFMAAGIALTASTMIRIEGFLLIIPFVFWSICRWWSLRESRRRLAAGAAMILCGLPAILLTVSFFITEGRPGEKIRQLPTILQVSKWQRSIESNFKISNDSDVDSSEQAPSPVGPYQIPPMSNGRMVWEYVRAMETGVTAVFGLLLLGGIYCWRGVWARGDNQPFFLVALIIMAGIWLDFQYGQRTSTRYPLTIVLMSLPFAALAFLGISQWLRELAVRFNPGAQLQRMALITPAVLVFAINFSEVSAQRYNTWESYANIGHWMRAELGRPPMIAGHESVVKVSNYYSGGGESACCTLRRGPATIAAIARYPNINFLLLLKRELRPFDPKYLLEELERMGYKKVDPARLPQGSDDIIVFELKQAEAKPAERPSKGG